MIAMAGSAYVYSTYIMRGVPILHRGPARLSTLGRRSAFPCVLVGALLVSGCISTVVQVIDNLPVPEQVDLPPTAEPPREPTEKASGWHRNIIATYFDIANYPTPQTAWNDIDPLTENPYYLALPFNNRVPGYQGYGQCKNRWVMLENAATGRRAYGQWEDVGPWFVNDVNYVFDEAGSVRPFAETHKGERWNIYRNRSGSGARAPRKVLNGAGIDLSPLLARELGIGGKGRVHWRFVALRDVPQGPWRERISTEPPQWRQRFYFYMGEEYKPWELTTTRFIKR